jgi:DNA-binding transcriptional regulator YdaS (Cro superfamily)
VRTLHRAALLAGGVAALAKYLQVPEQRLQQWLEGEDEAPEEAFLAALELVLIELERGRGPPS